MNGVGQGLETLVSRVGAAQGLPAETLASAPGKLYLAGEYAVVESGHPALLVAVSKMLTVQVSLVRDGQRFGNGEAVGRIHSEGHPEASVTWRRRGGKAVPDLEQPGAAFVLGSIHAVEELAVAQGRPMRMYDISIESELDDISGRKYGLGSSAAVTVAVTRALLQFYGLSLTPMQQYKLVFAASSRAQKVGSGGDLAASLFGGCIRFTAVERQWITARLQDTPLADVIDMPWPGLSVDRVDALSGAHTLSFMAGWTGSPASTSALVSRVQGHSVADHEQRYNAFLNSSDEVVDALVQALSADDVQAVGHLIARARALLGDLSEFSGTLIETPQLTKLIAIALEHGAAAKSSGAGGGDCGIAIVSQGSQRETIARQWQQAGIVPLEVHVTEPLMPLSAWGEGPYATGSGANRKDDHVRLALEQHEHEGNNAFDDMRFVHHSLGSISASAVSAQTCVCTASWDQPFYINAMTGGSASTGNINEVLARVAGATGVAIASGSQHAALRHPDLVPTFSTIRDHTDGFVFANIGPTVSPQEAQAAVEMIHADALQVHINAVQETVMPEGARDFSDWLERIQAIVNAVSVPVVVKEVGFGMSSRTVNRLAQLGVHTVDVSGRGGTDFARIENGRRRQHEYGFMAGWGQSTLLSLLDVTREQAEGNARDMSGCAGEGRSRQMSILASGGVRNPLDVVKALALGADAVGVSGHFLHVLKVQGERALTEEVERWKEEIQSLMALLGAPTVADLRHTDLLITGTSAQEAELLGIDLRAYARRSAC